MNRSLSYMAALALLVLALVPAVVQAAPSEAVLPPTAKPYGQTYSEWAARWWQWALGQPISTNPVLDQTGENCA